MKIKLSSFLFIGILYSSISLLIAQEVNYEFPKNHSEQNISPYHDKDLLPTSFFSNNRKKLRKLMPDNSVAILFSSAVKNRSNDVDYHFHQSPNFYYLTGLREPDAVVLIFKELQEFSNGISTDELLFLQPSGQPDEVWSGKRLGIDGAINYLGVNKAMSVADFLSFNFEFESFDNVFVGKIPKDAIDIDSKIDLFDLIKSVDDKFSRLDKKIDLTTLEGNFLPKLRQVKDKEELSLLSKAIDITCDAQIELMKSITPLLTEYQTQAIVEFIFKNSGAEHPGFPSIMGSGENTCVLHYTSNRKPLDKNDLLISDIGAEYHGYTADVTRTLPANGKFSNEQKIIYNIVLEAQQAGIEKCVEGNKFWAPHEAATAVIASNLMKLGLIKKREEVTKYFMHGSSHYLGLDVHDAGLFGFLEKGNVLTVEPGIYIPEGSDCDPKWWNIGVRIEDDILITEKTPINLSEKAPRKIEDIENLMQQQGIFKKP